MSILLTAPYHRYPQLRDSLARVCRLVPGADEIGAALLAAPTTASSSASAASPHSDSSHMHASDDVTAAGGVGFHQGGSVGFHQNGLFGGGSGEPLEYATFDGDRMPVSVEMSSM